MARIWTQAAGLERPCLELFYNNCLKTQILFLFPLKLFSHLLWIIKFSYWLSSSVPTRQLALKAPHNLPSKSLSPHASPSTCSIPRVRPEVCCSWPVVLGLSSPCIGRECPPLCFCRSRFHPLSCSRSFLPICSSPPPPHPRWPWAPGTTLCDVFLPPWHWSFMQERSRL